MNGRRHAAFGRSSILRAVLLTPVLALLLLAACGNGDAQPSQRQPRSLPELKALLRDARGEGFQALMKEVATHDSRAVPTLTTWLDAGELRNVREAAAHALGELAPQDEVAVARLAATIEDDDDYVRWKAIRALGRIGKPAAHLRPQLQAIAEAEREVEVVRAAAQRALVDMDAAFAESID